MPSILTLCFSKNPNSTFVLLNSSLGNNSQLIQAIKNEVRSLIVTSNPNGIFKRLKSFAQFNYQVLVFYLFSSQKIKALLLENNFQNHQRLKISSQILLKVFLANSRDLIKKSHWRLKT